MTDKITAIAVIGAGTMGNGIAHTCAQYGHPVTLVDLSPELLERTKETVQKNLDRQVAKELITREEAAAALDRIKPSTELADAATADLVIEAATEKSDLKCGMFSSLGQICPPQTILASNTSSISITLLGSASARPDKVIGMHFMNPVPVMKLVEVIRGHDTSDATHDAIMALATAWGKTPVSANDFPGFVANRVLMPMINEAIFCLLEGVAEARAIDQIMKLGMNHPLGPLALADLIGLDTCLSIMEVLHEQLGMTNTGPARCYGGWWQPGRWGAKPAGGFMIMPEAGSDDGMVTGREIATLRSR